MITRGERGFLRDKGVKLRRVTCLDDANDFMRWLGERRSKLGVDTETSSLDIEKSKIRYIQFGDLYTGWAIPWDGWSGIAMEALNKYEGDLLCHNLKFDQRQVTNKTGYRWPWHRSHDTMAMAHLINTLRPKGLKPLAGMLVDPEAIAAQKQLDDAMKDNHWDWATVPMDFPPYWIYGAMDPVLTCWVDETLYPEVMASYKIPYDLEMGTTRVVSKIETNGARVDLQYCNEKQAELLTWAGQARNWIRDVYGIEMTDTNVLGWFLENGIDVPDKLTKGGKQSMDKEVLSGIDHILSKTVLNVRKAEKTVGPYFKNFIKLVDENNRVHPNIWTMGTRTARMSITQPALQTLPRKDPTVRDAFIPSDGNVLITCDYDQIEARLMAHFSQSKTLAGAFQGPDDFFCTIASQIFGRQITKNDSERDLTKGTVYGKIYGAGIETMARTAGVPEDQMARVVSTFDSMYPEVRYMQKKIHDVGIERLMQEGMAYVRTPTGRRLGSDDGKEYTLTNYLIQSHAAEILKRKMIELDTALDDDCLMILPVHDELVFDVPADKSQDVYHEISRLMTDNETYSVPITASADLMVKAWGDKYHKKNEGAASGKA